MLHFFPHADGEEFFEYFDTDGSGLMDLDEFCVMIVRSEIGLGLRKEMVNVYCTLFLLMCFYCVRGLQIRDIQIIQIGGLKEMPKSDGHPEFCIIHLTGTLVGSCNMAMWLLLSQFGKRNIIFKSVLGRDMLVTRRAVHDLLPRTCPSPTGNKLVQIMQITCQTMSFHQSPLSFLPEFITGDLFHTLKIIKLPTKNTYIYLIFTWFQP